jgi:hypothetical protein
MMERSKLFLAVAATLAVACESPTAPRDGALGAAAGPAFDAASTSQTTFSGEATVVQARIDGLPPIILVETGKLTPSGGALHKTLAELEISERQTDGLLALHARVGHASAVGQGKRSRSQATVADLAIQVVGQPIKATFLEAVASAVCDAAGNAIGAASSEIAELTVAGQPIAVTGKPNQTIDLRPLLPIVIVLNEQEVKQSDNTADATVNALHITAVDPVTGKTVDVIVAQAHADITCGGCTDQGDDFTTGGGWIAITETGGRANFAVAGGKRYGWGHLTYHDKERKLTVKSETIDSYAHNYETNTSVIRGWATVNDAPNQRFTVTVQDLGEPGRGADTFKIEVGSYVAGNELAGGNIQFHDKPSRCEQ